MDADATQPAKKRPKRRWRQFTLRTLLVLVTIAAVASYYLQTEILPARQQRLAVEAILEGGGRVSYVGADSGGGLTKNTKNPAKHIPAGTWWTKLLGEDPRQRVKFVSVGSVEDYPLGTLQTVLSRWRDSDDLLQYVSDLRGLETLDAMGGKVTDAGLAQLGVLPDLKSLHLRHAYLSREGLSALRRMPKLQTLEMPFCPVSDDVFAEIGQVTTLEHLDMTQAHISGEGLCELTDLTNLHTLILDEVDFDGVDCKHLANLPQLKKLSLRCTSVTDSGADSISQITALEELDLNATLITDAGLQHLARLPRQKTLTIGSEDQCKYTTEGLQAFRDQRPDVNVQVSYSGTFNPAWLRREWAAEREK